MRLTRWDQEMSTQDTNEVTFSLSRWHLSQCNESIQATEVRSLIESQDLVGLCHYSLSYTGLTASDYRHLRQCLAFFTKRSDVSIGVNTREVAWKKALEAEELCRQTNEIFRKYFQGGFQFPLDVEPVLYRAQRKISTILGGLPSLEDLKLRFGPGATTQVKKKEASVRRKLNQMFACSEDALGILPDLLAELPLWCGLSASSEKSVTVPVQVDPCVVSFVPKNAKTDRTIAVEPMLNTLVQLGIGDYMAARLRKHGVDLTDQTRNQRLAREGSLTNALATLDLSSASDTIASSFVESMLPYEWWDFLRACRSGKAKTVDGEMRLEKFSSMGNGFTFPLESLIFYSLAEACCEPQDHNFISVYGDDIIVPSYAAPLLVKVLTSCGFLVNKDKSFFDGPFRESCGKDYLSGVDVRPSYLKGALSGQTCFVLHNFYVRTGQPEPAALLLEYLDESLRIFGPDGYGDGHLLGDHTLTPFGRERGWGGYTFETFTYKQRKAFYRLGADYVFPAYSIYVKGDNPPIVDAARFPKFRSKHSHGLIRPDLVSSRYDLKDGRLMLTDTLPGVKGYKRIKIYIHG